MAIISVDYNNPRYDAKALHRFALEALRKAGLSDAHATELADYLTATDLRGVLSHGTRRLPGYVRAFQSGKYNPKPKIRICLVTATHCGHTGSVGNWTRIATGEGMVCLYYSTPMSGLPFDRPQPVVEALNNPPVSFGFPPAEGEPPVLIDMGVHLELPDVQREIAEISVLPLIKGLAYQDQGAGLPGRLRHDDLARGRAVFRRGALSGRNQQPDCRRPRPRLHRRPVRLYADGRGPAAESIRHGTPAGAGSRTASG